QAEDGIRDRNVTGVQTCALPISAEFVDRYFRKGDMMAVSGRLQMREWTDKDGNRRTVAEVVADSAYFAGAKREETSPAGRPVDRSEERRVGKEGWSE